MARLCLYKVSNGGDSYYVHACNRKEALDYMSYSIDVDYDTECSRVSMKSARAERRENCGYGVHFIDFN